MVRSLFVGVRQHGLTFDIDAKKLSTLENGASQTRFEIFGTIAEVSFGCAHVCGVHDFIFLCY